MIEYVKGTQAPTEEAPMAKPETIRAIKWY